MNLRIQESGETKIFTLNANGEKVTEIIVDPRNATQPMERKAWTEDMGGTRPIEPIEPEPKGDAVSI